MMDIRDEFAGQALNGLLSQATDSDGQWEEEAVAKIAYRYADAMMRERDKRFCPKCQAVLRRNETGINNCPTCADIRGDREEGGAR